ncbi:MAG: hypothetical protein AB7T49_03615 [Oligoflexales bacterium]
MNHSLLRHLMEKKGVKGVDLAKACDYLRPSVISLLVNDQMRPGHKLRRRIERGMTELGFSKSEVESVMAQPGTERRWESEDNEKIRDLT